MLYLFRSEICCFPSLAEIQNARGIMDVLAEMLNALDPGNREVHSSYDILVLKSPSITEALYYLTLALLEKTLYANHLPK